MNNQERISELESQMLLTDAEIINYENMIRELQTINQQRQECVSLLQRLEDIETVLTRVS